MLTERPDLVRDLPARDQRLLDAGAEVEDWMKMATPEVRAVLQGA